MSAPAEPALTVTVEFLGPIRRPWPEQQRTVTLTRGQTVAALLQQLGYRPDELRYVNVSINHERQMPQAVLHEGDHVVCMLMVGGG
jgi:sulfur carrier protein ThiS